jgi:hypothetical protein
MTRVFGLAVSTSGGVMIWASNGNQNLLIGGVMLVLLGIMIMAYGAPYE